MSGTCFTQNYSYPDKARRIETVNAMLDSWAEMFEELKANSKKEPLLPQIQKFPFLSQLTAFLCGQSMIEARKKYRAGKYTESENILYNGIEYAHNFIHNVKTRIKENMQHA